MEETISLKEIFAILRKRILMIISLIISFAAIAFLVSYFLITPTYEASASVVVNQEENVDVSTLNNAIQSNISLINTYKIVMISPVILDEVSKEMNLSLSSSALAEKIEVTSEADTQIITVTATDTSQAKAAELANTTVTVFQNEIPELMNLENVKPLSLAEASENPSPASPNILLNTAIALVVGAVIGIGLAFLLEYMDNTVKTESDIDKRLGIPVIGIISHMTEEDMKTNKQHAPNKNRRQVRGDYRGQKKKTV
ncbi:YveK family protein [Terribacillus saccharophilus]|uniref:Capsular biosynthesis protein n=1 Tax=Terribacillus saccharophilus TaxID=361277 RepID=A0ABX4GXR7_9BACI|nr:Wzz/FepE/Etk N-terminal domain-containing protein [Terribacillus saccharophilus]PAD35267.1 capsular biosynthesis protein [Terribacillus saccharophilus]PAD96016.1 capsular biosynthesis protein [Terribacillus saccharophilus]PAD99660.1 capsular biosynthesis protein [Terribacillus saccharophilus]